MRGRQDIHYVRVDSMANSEQYGHLYGVPSVDKWEYILTRDPADQSILYLVSLWTRQRTGHSCASTVFPMRLCTSEGDTIGTLWAELLHSYLQEVR